MAGRAEYKYLVPNALLPAVRDFIRPHTEIDAFAGKLAAAEYTVRSIYYDSPQFLCYDEKNDGLRRRRKFRIRGYGRPDDDSRVFLEIKRKDMEMIEKSRAPVRHRDVEALLASGDVRRHVLSPSGTAAEATDAQRFLFHYNRLALRPAVLVTYDREAFFGRFDPSLRLSFDKNLRGAIFPAMHQLYDEEILRPAMRGSFTLEVKFFRRALPAWVRALVQRFALPRMSLSKFTICLDSASEFRMRSQMRGRAFSPVRSLG